MSEVRKKRSLGPGEKPKVQHKYPHMLPEDHGTWTAFIVGRYIELDEVWYDVHVGRPMPVPPGSPSFMKNVVDGISRKRIDVVGRAREGVYIIEVKPHANMEAVGQVVTYSNLFVEEFEITGAVQAVIVATSCDADILETANRLNVKIVAIKGVTL